jgi:hypothetical protein
MDMAVELLYGECHRNLRQTTAANAAAVAGDGLHIDAPFQEPTPKMSNENLVESSQWDAVWHHKVSPPLRPWSSYLCWRFHKLFSEFIKAGDRVLEVGCGGSHFLPYFAQRLGPKSADLITLNKGWR